jgi:hypothetical protein
MFSFSGKNFFKVIFFTVVLFGSTDLMAAAPAQKNGEFGWTDECVGAYCRTQFGESLFGGPAYDIDRTRLLFMDRNSGEEPSAGEVANLFTNPKDSAYDQYSKFYSTTPLHLAAVDIVAPKLKIDTMLEAGADPNAQINNPRVLCNGFSPLIFALCVANLKAAQALIEAGANVNLEVSIPEVDLQNIPLPLFWALNSGDTEMLTMLIDHGAKLDIQVYRPKRQEYLSSLALALTGKNPLHTARILIDRGAKVPDSLLKRLASFGIVEIPESQIDRTK